MAHNYNYLNITEILIKTINVRLTNCLTHCKVPNTIVPLVNIVYLPDIQNYVWINTMFFQCSAVLISKVFAVAIPLSLDWIQYNTI